MLDTLLLSRLQFASNISFHILFPSITIALCWFLVYFKFQYTRTGLDAWLCAYRFWVKIFALSFALGVVSGVTMSFQFGTNWPGYMATVGNIAGPLLGYEVLTAFFLEATFLGIMLFGIEKVSTRIHNMATLLVAVGTSLSAFWIVALNSWMQTPTGFEMRDGVAFPVDWWEIIFNPSMPYRLTHVLMASGLTASFLISGLSAYRQLRGDNSAEVKLTFKTALYVSALLIPLQIWLGDMHGLNTLKHQPAKIAAIEAVWHTEVGAPLVLFAYPDKETQQNKYSIEIPKAASLILTHDSDGIIKGLNEFGYLHPPVAPLFYAFRVMVAIGTLMLLCSWRGLYEIKFSYPPIPSQWLLKGFVLMTFSGWIATLAGWYVTEIGRQPYLVTGILLTKDAVTSTPDSKVATSLALYLGLYSFLLIAYVKTLFSLAKKAVPVKPINYINALNPNTAGAENDR